MDAADLGTIVWGSLLYIIPSSHLFHFIPKGPLHFWMWKGTYMMVLNHGLTLPPVKNKKHHKCIRVINPQPIPFSSTQKTTQRASWKSTGTVPPQLPWNESGPYLWWTNGVSLGNSEPVKGALDKSSNWVSWRSYSLKIQLSRF